MSENLISWEVFIQSKAGIAHKHVGSVHAPDGALAIQNARDVYGRREHGISIWVIPTEKIFASDGRDMESFFDPMQYKLYRQATHYVIPKEVKHM